MQTAKGNYVGINSSNEATCFVNIGPAEAGSLGMRTPNGGVFEEINVRVGMESILDGTSNTVMIGERAWEYNAGGQVYLAYAATQYMNRDTRDYPNGHGLCGDFGLGDSDTCATVANGLGINYPHADPKQAMNTLSSRHPGGANFARCDGSVEFFRQTIDAQTLVHLADKIDGRVIGDY